MVQGEAYIIFACWQPLCSLVWGMTKDSSSILTNPDHLFNLFMIMQLRSIILRGRCIDHGDYEDQLKEAGLTSKHVGVTVLSMLGKQK